MGRFSWTGLVLWLTSWSQIAVGQSGELFTVDYRSLVSRADLDYKEPASRSEEGMPVGNGRMGSLVWTTPSALRFQINRVDVFAEDSTTTSFPVQDSDYASGCGYMDIHVVSAGDDVFTGSDFRQHLAVYDGLMTAQGKGLTARVLAWPDRDVMAVEIEDGRDQGEAVNIDLRMLRYRVECIPRMNWELAKNHAVTVRTAEHSATSRLDIRDGRILLIQQFRERDFYDSSAVAIAVVGRSSRARYLNEATVQLSAAPGKGRFAVLISSAASFDPNQDVGELALQDLQAAQAKGFHRLQAETAAWWHDFWARGFVHMHSADGQADFVEQHYTYFLYVMGASSRGAYPPRFGGMLWYTNADCRRWGSQYWWANTNAYYSNLMPANRLELMDPMFSMYSGMYDACALAAVQQWGSKGIWIPEITFFNGPERLPDDLAAEVQELYLAKKPYEQRSPRFQWWAETKNRHNSRWNFQADGKWDHGHLVVPTKGNGIFGHCTHILSNASRIGNLFYQRYEFAMDKSWLCDRAYPIIKGAAEFYRSFPNFQKGDDVKYHIHHVNNVESSWNSSDTPNEVGAMRMIFPLAIRASEILDVDADMRPIWREISDNLVELPAPSARAGGSGPGGYGAFVYGGEGAIEPLGSEKEFKSRFLNFNRLASFIDGRGIGGAQILRNRMRLREGPGAIDCEHIGGLTSGIHSSLLTSGPEVEAGEPVVEVFSSWPKDWDAAFTLLARGAFLVSSSMERGQTGYVQIKSVAGGVCRLHNPWPDKTVTVCRGQEPVGEQSGSLLSLPMQTGETWLVVPTGSTPSRRSVP